MAKFNGKKNNKLKFVSMIWVHLDYNIYSIYHMLRMMQTLYRGFS